MPPPYPPGAPSLTVTLEILWENLQLTDEHEDRVKLWGYALTYVMILIGTGLLVANTVIKALEAETPPWTPPL